MIGTAAAAMTTPTDTELFRSFLLNHVISLGRTPFAVNINGFALSLCGCSQPLTPSQVRMRQLQLVVTLKCPLP